MSSTKQDYHEYLKSEAWKIRSGIARVNAGNRCQLCNSDSPNHVHHRTYDNRGTNEEFKDLIVLCAGCHAKFHGKGVEKSEEKTCSECDQIAVNFGQYCSFECCLSANTVDIYCAFGKELRLAKNKISAADSFLKMSGGLNSLLCLTQKDMNEKFNSDGVT